jgi:dihydrofolate reductase
MSDLVVVNHVTLDGVMQAPGGREEDQRDGFAYGGWAAPDNDPVMNEFLGEGMSEGGPLLLGRRTYEHFYGFWPTQTDGNPYTEVLNKAEKFVASRTLSEPLAWENSTLLKGDVADAVADVKAHRTKDIVILGSGDLIRTLMQHGLIDRYVLLIHPVVLGSGRRLFRDGSALTTLRLVDTVTTTKGVVIATYEPAR